MKKTFLLFPLAAALLATSCKKDETPNNPTPAPTDSLSYTSATLARTTNNSSYVELADGATLKGSITTNTVLKAGRNYKMDGFVFVRNGATLKVEEGVVVKGVSGTKASLIITRNGKIDAQGTATNPIRFTSIEATPNRGDWGGIILLGNANNNGNYNGTSGLQAIEGGVNTTTEGYGLHGGTNNADNSGTMKYVRIEYAGVAFAVDNEINGLTMGSVGNGTTLDHIEVYKSNDDGFEWFGGTVNAKYLISAYSTDDDFDTDNGFSGKVQYGISIRDNQQADFAQGGTSNGFESDNDASGTAATPRTAAVFSNFTMIGPKAQNGTPVTQFGRGAHIRRNSSQSIFNSVFVGWNTGMRIDGRLTNDNFTSGNAEFKNNMVVNASKNIDTTSISGATSPVDPAAFFTINSNVAAANVSDAMLTSVMMGTSFNPMPAAGAAILSGASFSSSKLSGLENVSYRGAAGTASWWNGWTRFDN